MREYAWMLLIGATAVSGGLYLGWEMDRYEREQAAQCRPGYVWSRPIELCVQGYRP